MRNHRLRMSACPERRRSARGVTFLELLIAITILVVVIVAILQLFDQDVEVRKQQDQMAEMQQNLRAAMDVLSRDVRAASACAYLPGKFTVMTPTPACNPPTLIGDVVVRVPLPIAAVWMPNVGNCPSGGQPCASSAPVDVPAGDNTRPDGIAVMRCISNGVVDVVGDPDPANTVTLAQGLGLQPGDVGKFLIFWTAVDDASATNRIMTPFYFTARIDAFVTAPTNTVKGEELKLDPFTPIQPTDDAYATFGKHWYSSTDPAISGKIMNFNPAANFPSGYKWKAALVEWVEYIVDKWDNNKIPHDYSDTTKEGSPEHPLLVRRINPHMERGNIVPEWDVIAHDIEDMQVVWLWDPDGNPENNSCACQGNCLPGSNLEYQAGDPSRAAQPPMVPGSNNVGVLPINALCPGIPANCGAATPMWVKQFDVVPPITEPPPTAAALRKVRVTLLARTREKDLKLGDAKSGGGQSTGFGFPAIEGNPNFLQGSVGIKGGVPSPPLFLSGYRRRSLTTEIALRNYVPGGMK